MRIFTPQSRIIALSAVELTGNVDRLGPGDISF